jgi:hypothetical protein
MLFTAPTLDEIAEAIRAQPEPDALSVYFHEHGSSRDLDNREEATLDRLLQPGEVVEMDRYRRGSAW